MNKILRSTFGTLMVTVFLTVSSTMYARGGRLGDHGVRRGGHGGHGHALIGHATAGHTNRRHGGFRARGERAHQFARTMRNWDGGRDWGGSSWYSSYAYSRFGYYGLGYVYPYYGYSGYYYGPYRYGYWPNLTISPGVLGPSR